MFYLSVLGTAMGTKLAPCYVSLSVAKLDMDIFVFFCDKTPLFCFRILDDIFMICYHNELDLHVSQGHFMRALNKMFCGVDPIFSSLMLTPIGHWVNAFYIIS